MVFFLPDDVDRDFGVCSHSCDAAGDGDRDDGDGDDDGDDDGDGNGDHHDGSDDKEALDNGVCRGNHAHHLHEELYSSQLLRLWGTGADTCMLCYRADEDEDFDVGNQIICVHK